MRRRVPILALLALVLVAGGITAWNARDPGIGRSDDGREAAAPAGGPVSETAPPRREPPARAAPSETPTDEAVPEEPTPEPGDVIYEGTVTRADTGEPVEGMEVHVRVIGPGFGCFTLEYTALTDAKGRWSESGAAGRARVFAQGGGWVTKGLAEAWYDTTAGIVARGVRRGSKERFDIVVEPAARISGRVFDAAGSTVAGAYVVASSEIGEFQLAPETDDAGRFVIGNLVPGATYSVSAWTDTCARAEELEASAGSGETAEIELRLAAPRSIEVIVLDEETGSPVAGAAVGAESTSGFPDRTAETDAGGRALLAGLPPGSVELSVGAPQHLPLPAPVELGAEDGVSGAVPRVEIRLRRAADVRITVLADDGLPLAGCGVTVTALGSVTSISTSTTGDDGAVRIPHLDPSATYQVRVDAAPTRRNLTERTLDAWTPKDDVVRLDRGLTIAGVVVDVAGRPLAGVDVDAHPDEDSSPGSAETDAAGRFEILRLLPGEYVVTSEAPGHAGFALVPEVRVAAGARDVRVVRDPGAAVGVRFSEGRPPEPWAEGVTLFELASGTSANLYQAVESPVWRATGLVLGRRYRVRRTDGEHGCWAAAEFVAGETAEVTLTMAPGKPLAGHVAVPPEVRAEYVNAALEGAECEALIDADGGFRFPGLAPGAWRISTWVSDDKDGHVLETVAEAGREDVVLDLRNAK